MGLNTGHIEKCPFFLSFGILLIRKLLCSCVSLLHQLLIGSDDENENYIGSKDIDERQLWQVDSMLGRRENPSEHEAMRKMKNEFMVNWDGLRTKDKERVLVLAATNRPFDLDEAVIRRLPRR